MLFPDLGNVLIPLTQDTPDDVGEWPANHAHGSLPGCRERLANYRAREGGKEKKLWCCDGCKRMVCVNEVWWRPYPTILPPPTHH